MIYARAVLRLKALFLATRNAVRRMILTSR